MPSSAKDLLNQARHAIAEQDFTLADQYLERLHTQYHASPWWHLQVHLRGFELGLKSRQPKRLLAELLPIIFALPVSWVQKLTGISRKLD